MLWRVAIDASVMQDDSKVLEDLADLVESPRDPNMELLSAQGCTGWLLLLIYCTLRLPGICCNCCLLTRIAQNFLVP